jgi:hypothetical protein
MRSFHRGPRRFGVVAGSGMQRGLECMGPSGLKALRMTSVLKKSRCSELKSRVILHSTLGAEAPRFHGGSEGQRAENALKCIGPSGLKALRMTSVLKKSRCSELKSRVILHSALGAEAPFHGGLGRPIHAAKERAGWEKKKARTSRAFSSSSNQALRRGAWPAQTLTGNLQRMVQAHFQDRALVQSDVALCEKASQSASACADTRANSSTLTAAGN